MKVEEILKQKDLDVNVADNVGWTALHEACNRGHVQCVKKILQYHGGFEVLFVLKKHLMKKHLQYILHGVLCLQREQTKSTYWHLLTMA